MRSLLLRGRMRRVRIALASVAVATLMIGGTGGAAMAGSDAPGGEAESLTDAQAVPVEAGSDRAAVDIALTATVPPVDVTPGLELEAQRSAAPASVQAARGAPAPTTGTLQGDVYGVDGYEYGGATVVVYNAATLAVADEFMAAGTGYLAEVDPGTYLIKLKGFELDSWADTFYGDQTSAAAAVPVTVSAGEQLTGLDIHMQQGRTISGRTIGAEESQDARLVRADSVSAAGGTRWTTSTAVTGVYTISGMGDDDYVVWGSETVAGVSYAGFYGGATREQATPVAVAGADVTDIDFALTPNGGISGTVSAADVTGVQRALVTAYRSSAGGWYEAMSATVDFGLYYLGMQGGPSYSLPSGNYLVSITDPGAPDGTDPADWVYPYCPQWYELSLDRDGAAVVPVAPHALTAGVDAELTLVGEGCPLYRMTADTPVISGDAIVGETLTATPGTWSPAGPTFTYQWFADKAPITGATTSPTLLLAPEQRGAKITVVVTGSHTYYADESAESAPTLAVAPGVIVAGTPVITGTAQVAVPLTLDTGTWQPADVDLAYQWLADGEPIAGATGTTFVPAAEQVGALITATVTGSLPGYTGDDAESAPTAPVTLGEMAGAQPTITGTARVGEELTAHTGIWAPAPVSFDYSWSADGAPIDGATGETLVLAPALVGTAITVTVTGSTTGYRPEPLMSEPTGPVAPAGFAPATPTISGIAQVGQTLTANTGTWAPEAVAFAYVWAADGEVITGEDDAVLTLAPAQQGATITVTVTGSALGYTTDTRSSTATATVAATAALAPAVPSISGLAVVGETLTADAGTWAPSGVALSYAWLADGIAIAGATWATYVPVATDAGKTLTVRVTGTLSGYPTVSADSVATARVPAVSTATSTDLLPGGELTVSGNGFVPGEEIRIELHSTPVLLATTTASANGAFSVRVSIPSNTPAGAHTLYAIGASGRTTAIAVTVGDAPASALTATGGEVQFGVLMAGLLLLGAGVLLRAVHRRRTGTMV